jgi:threonine dehydratase
MMHTPPRSAGADASALPVSYADVDAAARRLEGVASRTPVMTSRSADSAIGARAFFKCENFQRAGAFKFRGAYNALVQFTPEQRKQGVLAYSSGNHAQAIALAGRLLDIPATIVMPANAPHVKLQATREYGAEIILYDPATQSREELAAEIAGQRGMTVIPAFDHPHVVAGQGTAAAELIAQSGPLDVLLVPCGGGGLLSGCAIAADALAPACRVIGVEPALGDDATRSFHTRTLQRVHNPPTIADGARTPSLGTITFPLVLHYVDDMVTVTDEQIVRAMRFLWERMKLVVEPTGALAAAALLEHVVSVPGERVGIILSGGNVDLAQAAAWFAAAE